MDFEFLTNPVVVSILVVYFGTMILRAMYLLANDEFPHIFQFIFWQPFELMISIFGTGLGFILGFPFVIVGFILLCFSIPFAILSGVIISLELFKFFAIIFTS